MGKYYVRVLFYKVSLCLVKAGGFTLSFYCELGWIWKIIIPANVQFFLWQICDAAIPTKSVLANRGIPFDETCPFCGNMEETIQHCIIHCSRALEIWSLGFPSWKPSSAGNDISVNVMKDVEGVVL